MGGSSVLHLSPGSIVCTQSELRGDITIGANTIVHPKAVIIAEAGPIIIGENNIIEEQSRIINRAANKCATPVMIIGSNNVFEVGSKSYALKIGDNNILEAKSFVGRLVELTNGCVVTAGCSLDVEETLPENCLITSSEFGGRRIQQERPALQTLQIDRLSIILPNYHYLHKRSKPSTN